MSDQPQQPPNGTQHLSLTPEQYATMLVVDGLLSHIQTAVNQLGGFVKYTPAAEMVAHAGSVLGRDYEALKQQWQRSVVIAPAGALSAIEGKKVH